jgi:hypothetical protein
MKKKALPIYLDDLERQILEKLSDEWGVSLSAAVKRLIRERDSG